MVAKWSDPPKPKRRRKAVPLCETAFALSEQQARALADLHNVENAGAFVRRALLAWARETIAAYEDDNNGNV